MSEHLLVSLISILVLGVGAQVLAWRIGFPSILLLLIFGFVAGPVSGFLEPDRLFGDLLLPLVSAAVAIILFEGGLSLQIADIRETGAVVRNLVTFGALITWLLSAGAASLLLGLNVAAALLLGAVLVVTGPTVIIPLLKHVRPAGQVGSIMKWEGILIDPIGAILAVLVFEAVLAGGADQAIHDVALGMVRALFAGGLMGVLSGGIMVLLLQRYWIPDFLQNPLSLTLALGAFTLANLTQTESGLLSVTVMGVVLANQRRVSIKHIIEFKENLRVLLISVLFILLSARLRLEDLAHLDPASLTFLGILVAVVRPVSVLASTAGSDLHWRERVFLAWMAPRGIVAAAVASVFALELGAVGYPQADRLVPFTFLVIIGTVALYGLTAAPLARRLGLAIPNPQGVLIIGAHPWARAIARALQEHKYRVVLVDTDRANISAARAARLETFRASILSDAVLDQVDLGGIGRLLALTANNEVNALAALHFTELFGRSEVYQLPPEGKGREPDPEQLAQHLRGRLAFAPHATYGHVTARVHGGAVIKATHLTEQEDFAAFRESHGEAALPLFVIAEDGGLTVITADRPPEPEPGQILISLVDRVEDIPA
jgi:NhaP-type Na+/H+ or K+/H+ antiporter